jgi:hypothetical protein
MSTRLRASMDTEAAALSRQRLARIQGDLERLGVAGEVREELARRLEALTRRLTPEAYDALVAGVALAHGLHREEGRVLRRSLHDLEEIQRLIGGFSDELRKLDEALRTLSAYVRRMGSRADPPSSKTVH